MKVSDILESRRAEWHELETLCQALERFPRQGVPAAKLHRFSALYRAACADLALADSYQLPSGTIHYLHRLVGRAHNQLYRSRSFRLQTWGRRLLFDVPQQLFADNALRLAFCLFWGVFVLSAAMAFTSAEFAETLLGEQMATFEEMYLHPIGTDDANERSLMMGFYIRHNTSIGLQVFAFGLLFGIGGLFVTVYNAAALGAVFGHMATLPQAAHFFDFVTAHGPFELTAVVLAAAAGMRLGFAMIDTKGLSRGAALREAADAAMPTVAAAMILFFLAALIEAFISPSAAPYWTKAAVAAASTAILAFYFVALGYPRRA